MANFNLTASKTAGELKQEFNEAFGAKLKVYNKNKIADDAATLGELGLKVNSDFECRANRTAGSFIAAMAKFGLKVKVYTLDEWVAVLSGLTLESAGKVKKNATKADMEGMIAYQRENNVDVEDSVEATGDMQTICIKVGGRRGKVVKFMFANNDDFKERLEELRDNFDQDELLNYIYELNMDGYYHEPVFMMQPCTDDYATNVIVENEDGDVLFEEEIPCGENMGDPNNWKYDEAMSDELKNHIEGLIKTAIEESDDTEDQANSAAYSIGWADTILQIKEFYRSQKLDADEAVETLVHSYDSYDFMYTYYVQIPVGEEFDSEKLALFTCDYDSAAPDFCEDSVAPIIKYDDVLYEAYKEDPENHYDYCGFATIDGAKDYVAISFDGGDFD